MAAASEAMAAVVTMNGVPIWYPFGSAFEDGN